MKKGTTPQSTPLRVGHNSTLNSSSKKDKRSRPVVNKVVNTPKSSRKKANVARTEDTTPNSSGKNASLKRNLPQRSRNNAGAKENTQ